LSGEFFPVNRIGARRRAIFMAYINELHNQNQSLENNPNPCSLILILNKKLPTKTRIPILKVPQVVLKHIQRLGFRVPQEEFSETRHITRAYTKLLGKFPTTSELPRRKETCVQRPNTHPDIYIDSIDDLIETALQEVPVPLSRVTHTLVEPEDNLEGENPKINLEQIMGEHRDQRIVIPCVDVPRCLKFSWTIT
jgi:hypothetical protein